VGPDDGTVHRIDADTDASRWRAVLGPTAKLPPDGQSCVFEVDGRRIAVFNVGGEFHAIDDTCTHRPASLSEDGELDDGVLVCGWHGSMFDLATGKNVGPPACDSLRTYDLEINTSVLALERG
jgi:nitrite reductase/ring-hydroxylating ferredoxin subunit